MRTLGLWAVWLIMLGGAAFGAWFIWRELGDVEIGTHGYIALGLGVGFSLLVGVGLMRLVYISSKRGYDE